MKRMLKKQIVWLMPLAMTFAGCSDLLDKLPENTVPVAGVDYTKTDEMYQPVSGVYATAQQNFSSWTTYGLMVIRGDDVDKGSSPTDQIEFLWCKEFKYDRVKSFWALDSAFQWLYYVVTVANSALESLDRYAEHITLEADRARCTAYRAEVRFLRAYAYFRLMYLWGDVPILENNQELNVAKSHRAEVLAYLLEELQYCIDWLPALRPTEQPHNRGAVTKYSALALLAKVQLYEGNWEAVVSATEEIIQSGKFSLYPDYYQLFKIPGKLCDESLYELQFTDFATGSGDIVGPDAWFTFQGPRGGDKPIEGWGFITPTAKLDAFMRTRGESTRLETTFLRTGETTLSGDYIKEGNPGEPTAYNGKAYTPSAQMTEGRNDYGANNNVRILRYADVLLMHAEATIRLGRNGDASLNEVRRRAGLEPVAGATVEDVLDERFAELAMEWGDRFFDLVRTGRAAAELPGFVEGRSEYYPIPQNQIDLNPNLNMYREETKE